MIATTPSWPPDLPRVTGLTADSRAVKPGFLFAALPGARVDGRAFIGEAVANGATVVLAPEGASLPVGAPEVRMLAEANPRARFARLAAAFYGRQPETIAAVTGTAGKTSTVNFARQIWERLGYRAASLGTLGLTAPNRAEPGALTTPDPVRLHGTLADLAAAGVTHLAIEASSHGLDQYRLDGVAVGVAGFTNLSREHLDYHPTMAAYLAAKTRLFTEVLAPGGAAVINADTPEGAELAAKAKAAGRRPMTYGRAGAAFRLDRVEPLAHGLRLALIIDGRSAQATVPLTGAFQAHNVLCALGLVIGGGGDPAAATAALGHLAGVRGRLELAAQAPNGAPIYVDYAHKPGALETVLLALRPHTKARLVVVFGCGGDRDPGKRAPMGAIAARLADRVIVTDDNPRTEEPAAIRAAVMKGCPGAEEIGDRAEAIAAAIAGLDPNDLLVVAGKGHETGQIIGDTIRPFDDAEVVRSVVKAMAS